jgi:hypothetical protein
MVFGLEDVSAGPEEMGTAQEIRGTPAHVVNHNT